MQILGMRQETKIIALLMFFLTLIAGCDILTNGGDEPPPPNVLSVKDSLAVRAILDINGLNNVITHVPEILKHFR